MRSINLSAREGYYLCLETKTARAYSEYCPLYPVHHQSFLFESGEVLHNLAEIKFSQKPGDFLKQVFQLPDNELLATFQWALLDLYEQENEHLFFQPLRDSVEFNALVTSFDDEKEAEELQKQGFQCIKIKVAEQDIDKELKYLHRLPSEIKLRLDANRKFSTGEALEFLGECRELNIDYLEEPLQEFSELSQLPGGFRYALDESLLTGKPFNCDIMVIKPLVFKNLSLLFRLLDFAKENDKEVVVSSIFESHLSFYRICRLALALPTASSYHGLGTHTWFQSSEFQLLNRANLVTRQELDNFIFKEPQRFSQL